MQPIRETPPSVAELKRMLAALDGNRRKLVNTSSRDYRESGLKDRIDDLTDAQLFAELQANGNLVKRPFLLTDAGDTTGFKADRWEALLGDNFAQDLCLGLGLGLGLRSGAAALGGDIPRAIPEAVSLLSVSRLAQDRTAPRGLVELHCRLAW